VQSERELPFAGLQHLCAPTLDGLDAVPGPQREALRVAFGLQDGAAPGRFLLADAPDPVRRPRRTAAGQTSALALAFVACRLLAEPVAMAFAVRGPGGPETFAGLPEPHVQGLSDTEARALLASTVIVPMNQRIRDRSPIASSGPSCSEPTVFRP
jgi:hypothetical protein